MLKTTKRLFAVNEGDVNREEMEEVRYKYLGVVPNEDVGILYKEG